MSDTRVDAVTGSGVGGGRTVDTTEAELRQAADAYVRRLLEQVGGRFGLLSIFEGDRQHFLGADGLPDPEAREIPLLEGFCQFIRDGGHQLVVDDVAIDTRVAVHPLVAELDIRAYAGWQVAGADGEVVGVLCAMDDRPRQWTNGELTALMDLARECGPTVRAAVAARAG
jgi:GAF domain-containing protein